MIIKFITTRIESIARSAARRPRYAPAHPQLFRSCLTITRGGHIAAVCFRLRSPPDLYFAAHKAPTPGADSALRAMIADLRGYAPPTVRMSRQLADRVRRHVPPFRET